MKQLRLTTTKPYGMFAMGGEHSPLVMPKEHEGVLPFKNGDLKTDVAYIHGDAEDLAGFDIPVFIDGDILQMDAPELDQDILLMLPNGNHQCIAKYIKREYDKDQYHIILKP